MWLPVTHTVITMQPGTGAIVFSILAGVQAFPSRVGGPRTFPVLSATVRDSSSYPLVSDPFRINKLTCSSLLTLLDFSTPALTVSADACLILGLMFASFGALPMLLAPPPSAVDRGEVVRTAAGTGANRFVDVGQGVFDKQVASLRIPVENLLSSSDAPGIQRRKLEISQEELKRFNNLPKIEQEIILQEAVLALERTLSTRF